MTTRKLFILALAVVCLSILIWPIVVGQRETAQAAELFQVDQFLGPIYYGSTDVWNVFDHDLPLYDIEDGNDWVLHYDGVRYDPPIPFGFGYDQHRGIDYGLRYVPVLAAADGTVFRAGWTNPQDHRSSYGLHVRLQHDNDYATIYAHFSSLAVRTDDNVEVDPESRQGILGISGNTGACFSGGELCPDLGDPEHPAAWNCAPHLHFEVRDPQGRVTNPYGWIGPAGQDPWEQRQVEPQPGTASHNLWRDPPRINTGQYSTGAEVVEPPAPEPLVTIDDGDDAYSETPGNCMQDNSGGWNGNFRTASVIPDENAASDCTARWTVTSTAEILAGDYEVYVHIPDLRETGTPDLTRGAVYRINHRLDNGDMQESQAIVVQVVYPNNAHPDPWVYIGRHHFAWDGTEFIEVGNATFRDDGAGFVVAADAVKFVPPGNVSPTSVTIGGPATGTVNTGYTFTATVSPDTATQPITYTWQATGQSPVVHTGGLTDTVTFTWSATGTQVITVTAANAGGIVTGIHTITIGAIPPTPTPVPDQWLKLGTWEVGCDTLLDFEPVTARQFKFQMLYGGGPDNHISFYCCGSSGAAWWVNGAWEEVTNRSGALDVGEWRQTADFGPAVVSRQRFSVGCNDGERMGVDVYYLSTGGATPTPPPAHTPTPMPTPSYTPTPTPWCRFPASSSADAGSKPATTGWDRASAAFRRLTDLAELADLLYRVRDELLSETSAGQHYIDVYYAHSAEIANLMLADPELDDVGFATLDLFVPGLEALLDGQGDTVTITAEQVKQAEAFLDALSAAGSPELRQAIAEERARRPLEQTVGMTFDEAWAYLNGYSLTWTWLPPVSVTDPYTAQVGSTIPVQFTLTDLEGNFVADDSVTLQLLDADGNVVAGPVGLADNPSRGIVIRGHKYHYNLQTKGLPPGTYTLAASYNSATPGLPATVTIVLKDK